jgi:hypothetical protein
VRQNLEKQEKQMENEECQYYLREIAPGRIVESWCGKPAFDYIMEEDAKVWLCPEHLSQVDPKSVSGAA